MDTQHNVDELPRLTDKALGHLPDSVVVPQFDVRQLRSGIVHLGCGAFHRAHQAAITQKAIDLAGESGLVWGIESVCMKRENLYDILREQDNLYSLLLREPDQTTAELIGTFTKVLHAPTDEQGVHHRIADPDIKIVTLSVTPGGYSINTETYLLNEKDPDVQADLQHIHDPERHHPLTTVGIISTALHTIRDTHQRPPVFLSCDNVTSNGATLRQAVIDFTELYDSSLAQWISQNVQFPISVVDRIAQPETSDDIALAAQLLGYRDLAPVPTEPLWDWTIQEFDGPRPLWAELGVRFVHNIEAYELGKLRLLNAAHMLLAYVGVLAGYTTIAESAADPVLAALTRQFMIAEAGETLDLTRQNLEQTAHNVMQRFSNSAIRQEISRIGRNGSEKMIPRVTDALRENLTDNRFIPSAALLLIASWIYGFVLYSKGEYPGEIIEPKLDELADLAGKNSSNPQALADAFLARTDLLGKIQQPELRQELIEDLDALMHDRLPEIMRKRLLPEFGGTS